MTVHPMLKQNPSWGEIEQKVRDLQRATGLLAFIGTVGVDGAHNGATPNLEDMRGIAWLGEVLKDMADDLDATLFPKTPTSSG